MASELGNAFDLSRALRFGCQPEAGTASDPAAFLRSHLTTDLREEVQQEGLTRNLGSFSRFLEAASFSQATVLNLSEVARECSMECEVVEPWIIILEDLLLAIRLPASHRRAKRDVVTHPKLFLFDTGVNQAVRPRGPLDAPDGIAGAAAETRVIAHLRAANDSGNVG